MDLLLEARNHWMALQSFRDERRRCKRYTYGDQWSDRVMVDGRWMREEDYIRQQGNIPLKNNLIRRLVRNVLGVFRNNYTLPSAEELGVADREDCRELMEELARTARANDLGEIHARTMEEFLISGMAVHRKWRGTRGQRTGLWTDYVQPEWFFIDSDTRDFRGWDATAVGELHDVDFPSLCASLARSEADYTRLSRIYSGCSGEELRNVCRAFGAPEQMASDFLSPAVDGRCRVVELWRKEPRRRWRCHDTRDGRIFKIERADRAELVDRENGRRRRVAEATGSDPALIRANWILDEVWRFYFIAPTGEVIAEGESDAPDGSHPYVFKGYPFIDGEIHSFVADCLDQQRYINRLITLYDWIMRASAKGVLLFPEGALPDDADIREIADEWSRFNGVITYKPRSGMPLPQQISSNAANIGITELLDVQLKMMEDVSGVNSALQGKLESGATSGTLYNLQTRHALTGLQDLLESYRGFMRDCALRDLVYLTTTLRPPAI